MRSLRPTPGPRSKGEGPRRRRGEEIDGLGKTISVGAADTKISSRGGEGPVEVAPGDMMALRRVGETNGLADWARRASPRFGGRAPHGCGASLERDSGRRDVNALAAPRPAQGWRRTDRSPQTSVAPYGARRLANGRNAVKPSLFCEPSGQNIIQSSKAPV